MELAPAQDGEILFSGDPFRGLDWPHHQPDRGNGSLAPRRSYRTLYTDAVSSERLWRTVAASDAAPATDQHTIQSACTLLFYAGYHRPVDDPGLLAGLFGF